MALRGNQRTARALNRRLVLDELRRNGPISRTAIAEAVGLSPAAVTLVTAELIEQGLLVAGEALSGSTGRRPVPLDIKYSAKCSIGLKVSVDRVEGVITDLATRVIADFELPFSGTSPEIVVAVSAKVADRLLKRAGVDRRSLIGIGLVISGQVDAEAGVCRQMQRFGWRDVPMAAMLADIVAVPVWIENDANAFAVSQHLFGLGRGARSMVAVAVGRGVGAGLIIDGRLHRGAGGAAGEFGHSFEERGRTCECGRDGCLEAYCADSGLLLSWQMLEPSAGARGIEDLREAADTGSPSARRVLRESGTRLGHHVAGLVNIVDPELIVFGGEGVRFWDHLLYGLRPALDEASYAGAPRIAVDDGGTGWPQGAAALAVNHFFNFEATGGYTPNRKKRPVLDRAAA